MSRQVATFFGVGLMRPAAGTWGSAAALILGLALYGLGGVLLVALAALLATLAGFWACARELKNRPGEDPSEIVIDEVAGQLTALTFPAAAFWWVGAEAALMPWPAWVAAFVLFRLFDIWKPGLIGAADRRHDPAGVMLDDLIAGVFAGLGVLLLGAVAHLVIT